MKKKKILPKKLHLNAHRNEREKEKAPIWHPDIQLQVDWIEPLWDRKHIKVILCIVKRTAAVPLGLRAELKAQEEIRAI